MLPALLIRKHTNPPNIIKNQKLLRIKKGSPGQLKIPASLLELRVKPSCLEVNDIQLIK